MAENENPPGENENPPPGTDENPPADDDDDEDEGDGTDDAKATVPKSELDKAVKRRTAALARAKKAEDELAKIKAEKEGADKPDPVKVANERLVRQSARTALAAAGITDKDDQKAVLGVLKLDDIDVDDDGPDEDAIEERIEELRRILGAGKTEKRTTPKTVRTQDKGGKGDTTTDPDAARYKRILRRT